MNKFLARATPTLCAFTLLLAGALAAETPADASARVDAVLAKYVESLGGKAVIQGITNSLSKGTVTITGMEMSLELQRAAPDKMASRIEVAGMGVIRDVCDGTHAWTVNPFAGSSEKAGAELAKTKRDATFHLPLQLKQVFSPLAYKGAEKLTDRPCEVLESKPAGGGLERFYFSSENGQLVRRDSELETAQGLVKTETWLDDYRAVDGLQQPHAIRLKLDVAGQPPMDIQFKLTEVRQNVTLPGNAFAKPQ